MVEHYWYIQLAPGSQRATDDGVQQMVGTVKARVYGWMGEDLITYQIRQPLYFLCMFEGLEMRGIMVSVR